MDKETRTIHEAYGNMFQEAKLYIYQSGTFTDVISSNLDVAYEIDPEGGKYEVYKFVGYEVKYRDKGTDIGIFKSKKEALKAIEKDSGLKLEKT